MEVRKKMRILNVLIICAGVVLTSFNTFAGVIDGPYMDHDRLVARQFMNYDVKFKGNEDAVVVVRGDGHGNLDCYAYDANGNRVASDSDNQDNCLLEWKPSKTAMFRIVVANHGDKPSSYTFVTN